jgi:ribosomal protein S18 acetylase RimI-like enzyme
MDIHELRPDDLDGLHQFFERVTERDRTFFREDVADRSRVATWLTESRARRMIAVDNGTVVAYLALVPDVGWSSHVCDLRLVVDPNVRRKGLGRGLALRGLTEAIRMGMGKVTVSVVADQTGTTELFRGLGFQAEALLLDHVRDTEGELQDLIILAHAVDETRLGIRTIGLDEIVQAEDPEGD